jgi:YVTN family beta-propeller protein
MQFAKKVSSWATVRPGRSLQGCLGQSVVITLITWFGGPTPSAAQATSNNLASRPAIVYVSNGGGGITEVNAVNNSVIATAPFPNNANGVAITPDGRWVYASNRDVGQVTVFDARTNVPLTVIPVGNGNDNLGLAISPDGELVYVANQMSGTVTVIDTRTNNAIQVVPTGLEPIWITFSKNGSRAYVSNQASGTVSVITTASGTVVANIGGFACPFQSKVTRDGSNLLVSSQCDGAVKVVNLSSNAIVNSIVVVGNPRGIALTPDGTRAYVADFFSNIVNVIDVASQTNLHTPDTVGANPWGIAMTPSGKAYVANFGDNTISVIDTSTNTVTATLRSRGFPEDVTVSTTARPRILNYSFQAFDPPGSVTTLPRAVNNRGQNVGGFQDGAGVLHGYQRQPDGSLVTIDVPGSVLTFAGGINDTGTIVGEWQAPNGAFHGFTRSPLGVYSTLDFPGATDSGPAGINNPGAIVGVYNFGDQSTNIGFVDSQGAFTSIEDPNGPLQTQSVGINSLNFISGTYQDTAGNSHGFVRGPNGKFLNYDFPGADTTTGTRINDFGQTGGGYATNFPAHGFILRGAMAVIDPPSSSQFFSFDYPDSQRSALNGINNKGQVAGNFRLRGSPATHGFIATPIASEQGDQNNQ